ncbi:uncharacterized protein LOC120112558 [Phoenix dactylifera]|uniref:Uncharacterized protein LOC120112558 n=1 Tax=Phoenix dactylifera TaxID=42345 RepID=A0A8B9ANU4_PHODC|nr:uncharacterized protein LOC120112558 [Phoenix dactylifera]
MVTSNAALFARYKKRAAEAGGAPPEPKKKAKLASTSAPAERAGPKAGTSGFVQKETPSAEHAGSGSRGARDSVPPACPASISQRPGRQVVLLRRSGPKPGHSLGVPSPSHPSAPSSGRPSSSRADVPSLPEVGGRSERGPDGPESPTSEGDSALHDSNVAREIFRRVLFPADWAEFETIDPDSLVDQIYCTAIQHLHEINMLVLIALECQEKARRSQRQQEGAEKRLAESEAARREAVARMEAAEYERRSAIDQLEEKKASHALAKSELRASEARLVEARFKIAGRKYEEGVLRLKIEQLEAREKRALEEARDAVQLLQESKEFPDLMEEEAVD